MSLPSERETVIQFDDDEKSLNIYSIQSAFINMMKRRGYEPYKIIDEAHYYKDIPAKYLTIRKQSTAKRKPMSPEHKAKLLASRGSKEK